MNSGLHYTARRAATSDEGHVCEKSVTVSVEFPELILPYPYEQGR